MRFLKFILFLAMLISTISYSAVAAAQQSPDIIVAEAIPTSEEAVPLVEESGAESLLNEFTLPAGWSLVRVFDHGFVILHVDGSLVRITQNYGVGYYEVVWQITYRRDDQYCVNKRTIRVENDESDLVNTRLLLARHQRQSWSAVAILAPWPITIGDLLTADLNPATRRTTTCRQ
ncbi:hypothetical protein KKF05_01400 [Patescibacteria group bacterium]|nr:hypothetical protein [Patescibacteria group bacterium]MBU1028966.1 hypothetical protein [Patescibacteria group bacterium]